MISVNDAKNIIQEEVVELGYSLINIEDAVGYVAAEDIYTPIALPPFDQSAMDGYAIAFQDIHKENKFTIQGEVAAGGVMQSILEPQTAVRIFTGASLPKGADTVVMQEHTSIEDNMISFNPMPSFLGQNVRVKGSHLQEGAKAIHQGQYLSAAAIAHISGLGINKVKIYNKPRVAIITTGDEVLKPGDKLIDGHIYDANQAMLVAVLKYMGITPTQVTHVKDDEVQLQQQVSACLNHYDILLITGGVSVGNYDYVVPVLSKLGVEQKFHNVKQKPGKPLYFGKYNKQLVFGLPGNPASVLTCFYEYVYIAIQKLMGNIQIELPKIFAHAINTYNKKRGLTHFLKAYICEDGVEILEGQESYILQSYAQANCLVRIPEEVESIKENDIVEVHLIL